MAFHHQIGGRIGAYRSWANTPDRSARTEPARRSSPAGIDYHLARLDPDRFADASDDQRLAAAEAARRAHFAELTLKSARARRRAVIPMRPPELRDAAAPAGNGGGAQIKPGRQIAHQEPTPGVSPIGCTSAVRS